MCRIKKKTAIAIAMALTLMTTTVFGADENPLDHSTDCFPTGQNAEDGKSSGGTNLLQQLPLLISVLGNKGLSMGGNTTYTVFPTGKGLGWAKCTTTNSSPVVGDTATVSCNAYAFGNAALASQSTQSVEQEYTSAGNKSLSFSFPLVTVEEGQTERTPAGEIYVTVNTEVKETTSSLSEDSNIDSYYASEIAVLPDDSNQGTIYDATTPVNKTPGTGDPGGSGSGGGDGGDGEGLPKIDDPNNKTNLTDNTNNASDINSSSLDNAATDYNNYGNSLLDDLADSFNSGDNDWSNSNLGNDGESSLNDYFNGVEYDGDGVPGGLTADLLGVDGYMVDEASGDGQPYEGGAEYQETSEQQPQETDGSYSDPALGGGGAVSIGGGDSDSLFGVSDFASMYQNAVEGALDPMNGSNSDLLQNMSTENQSALGKKFRQLLFGDDKTTQNPASQDTAQELFEIAQQQLLAEGITMNDIKNGLNYSPNSAYTDPNLAWDFNRISQLLKKNRVRLNQQSQQK